jgi:hypothetical protein
MELLLQVAARLGGVGKVEAGVAEVFRQARSLFVVLGLDSLKIDEEVLDHGTLAPV